MQKMILRLFCLLCAAVLCVSLWKIGSILWEYSQGVSFYNSAASQYVNASPSTPFGPENAQAGAAAGPPIAVDFDALRQQNPDVVGWLYCEGTLINYPVMQGDDNDEYLHHMLDGSYNSAGSLFLDWRCADTFTNPTSVIYGHNMKNDSMFGTLHDYSAQEYYDAHPVMWLLTPDAAWRIDLIAGYVTQDTDRIYQLLGTTEELHVYLDDILRRSTFVPSFTVDPTRIDQAVFLSTCSYETETSRYILVGIPTRM